MKKLTLLTAIFISFSMQNTFCQTVLLKAAPGRDTIPETFGPNLKHYRHAVFAFGLVFGESGKQLPVKTGSSYEFCAAIRIKRKVTPVYSFGYDFFYRAVNYYIDQDEEKKIPDTIRHKSQKFNFFSFGLGFYNRFNFDPHRGNFLGTYVDAGITGEWDFTVRTVTRDILTGDEKIKMIAKNFDYVNSFSSRVFLRGGKSRFLLCGSYRITDHFKSSSGFPELPRFIAGVEINIF